MTEEPQLRVIEPGHETACHFAGDVSDRTVSQVVQTQDVIHTAVAADQPG